MSAPIFLANKFLTTDEVLSASSEFDQFINQPTANSNNTGDLSLVSSGSFRGTEEIDIKIEIKTAGDTGTAQYIFSDDGGTTFFGVNKVPVFEDFEVITEGI